MSQKENAMKQFNLETQCWEDGDDSGEVMPLDFLCAVFRDESMPLSVRMRAAIEAAPFFHPKLAVNAKINAGDDFASRLERAILRSGKILSPDPSRPKAPLALPLPAPSEA
jgi:hypothetical protein